MSLGACYLTGCVAEVSAQCLGYQPCAQLPSDHTKLSLSLERFKALEKGCLSKSCNNEQNYKKKKPYLLR